MKKIYTFPLFLLIAIIILSCSNTKYLKEDETLFVGSKVSIKDDFIQGGKKKDLEKELNEFIRPRENTKLLGVRWKLLAWNLAGEPKSTKGIRAWVRNKFGEPPVLGEDVKLEFNNLVIENQLFNRGFFVAKSDGEKEIKNQKTKAIFNVRTGPRYIYNDINYNTVDTAIIYQKIAAMADQSLLKVGNPYDLEVIKSERERIAKVLNNDGYYFFNPDYIQFLVDTSIKDSAHVVNAQISLRREIMPIAALRQFSINTITIYPDYNIENRNQTIDEISRLQNVSFDTIVHKDFTMIDAKGTIRPIVFEESILYKPGDLYNENTQNKSLTRLVGTGVFKFVKNDYRVARDRDRITNSIFDISYNALLQRGIVVNREPKLDLVYSLTQYPKKRINLETTVFTQDDNRGGGRLNLNWRNRNFLRGAEIFSARAIGGMELQYGGALRRPNIYNLGLEASLEIPRFIVPFFKIKPTYSFLPKTVMTAKFDYYLMNKVYDIYAASFRFGYNWKEDARKEHRFFPIDFTYVRTDTLGNRDSLSQYNLRNVVYNGIIVGPTYEYTYNSKLGNLKKHNYYFSGLVDLGGNLTGLIQGADYRNGPSKILDNIYAQYAKFQTDFRYYYNINSNQSIATRIFTGIGIPYGNSSILPNIKQLFAGGISSLRGFNARMVGPGTYNELYQTGRQTYVEMLGDIKLETNVEYRTKLYSILNGAVFMDAGNIWLYRTNANFPGGHITRDFYKQIAVNGGIGLRVDVSVLLLRLDVAIPFRKPWLPDGDRWVFDKIDFGSGDWRRQNIIYGFAIGLPF